MKQKHVVVINVFFAPYTYGGATIVAERVAQALKEDHNYLVTAISATSRTDIPPYTVVKVEKNGIANYLINLPFERAYAQIYDNSQVTEVVNSLLQILLPDILHIHCIQDIGAGIISAAKQQGLPVVLSTHDFWWLCERQFMIRMDGRYCNQSPVKVDNCQGCVENIDRARLRASTLKQAANQADVITHPSQFASDLNQSSGLSANCNMVWSNGVVRPKPDFFALQAARRTKYPRMVFGFVGGPSQIKGWPIIRKAFSKMDRDDFDVYVVDGSIDGSWWDNIDLSDLPGRWTIYPRFEQKDMDKFYARIDVLLFLSQWRETFGLTIREAISRGIHVIQTDSGGTTEHPMANPKHMLKIGDGEHMLRKELEQVLRSDYVHPQPINVTSFAEQAAEMAKVFETL